LYRNQIKDKIIYGRKQIMQIPKSPRRQKLREKQCTYPGCGQTYFGFPNAKYCLEHRSAKYRIKTRIKPENVNLKNQTLNHSYTQVTNLVVHCALEGCNRPFEIKIYPRQFIYPKYCPEHRNEFRRIHQLKQIHREDLIETMKGENEFFELKDADQRI
jgi:hypothetical protein